MSKIYKNYEEEEEAIRREYEEEAMDRKAKATVQASNSTRPAKMAKFHLKKRPLIKQVICDNCGKLFKTNSNKKLCFNCQKTIPKSR